jgi:hypothetical protein
MQSATIHRMKNRQPGNLSPGVTLSEPLAAFHVNPASTQHTSRRVYLPAPASWKSARSAVCTEAMDWSALVSPHAQQTNKWSVRSFAPVALLPKLNVFAASCIESLRANTLAVLSKLKFANLASDSGYRAVRWHAWTQTNRRRVLATASLCTVFGTMAVPLGMHMVYSQKPSEKPLPAIVTQSAKQAPTTRTEAPVAVPAQAPTAARPSLPSSLLNVSLGTNTPAALLADVSTMDLTMPIAEPDLNIASQQSLWAQVGKESGVDPLLLYSVALVESRSLLPGGKVGPTPWLFRVNDHLVLGERHHVQLEMAVASQLGSAVQDVGIMQVYYPMHRDAVSDPLALLDPRTNISVAAKILHDGMHETRDPVLGVGYYHSHTPQLAKDYGAAVLTVYQRLKGLYRPGKPLRS